MSEFAKYGLYLSSLKTIASTTMASGKSQTEKNSFVSITMSNKTYSIIEILGKGTYGETFLARSSDGKDYAIKRIELHHASDWISIVKEALIHIILYETSLNEPKGPYVPIFYEIAYDPSEREVYIRTELMRNTVRYLLKNLPEDQKNQFVPTFILDIANILRFFGEKLQFNHRDMKSDNIMYIRDPTTNLRLYKLIDFGFSCLTYKGVKIKAGNYYAAAKSCYRTDRDLSMLLYEIVNHFTIAPALNNVLNGILVANIKSKGATCEMSSKCGLKVWTNIYKFMNRDNVSVNKGNPNNVQAAIRAYLNQHDAPVPAAPAPVPAAPAPCPPDKVLNPASRRCVKKDGALGRKLLNKDKGKNKGKNNTRKNLKPCPSGSIRNPKTRRCVKETSKLGKQILAAEEF